MIKAPTVVIAGLLCCAAPAAQGNATPETNKALSLLVVNSDRNAAALKEVSALVTLSAFSPTAASTMCAQVATVQASEPNTIPNSSPVQENAQTQLDGGCVLPLTDAVEPVSEVAPIAAALSPLFLAIPTAAAAAAVIASETGDDNFAPVSPD